jgi:thiol-disulfide isomerase/thioredoxin
MKSLIKIGVIAIFIGLLSFLVYNVVTKSIRKKEIDKTLQSIPAFSFTTMKKTSFTNKDLKPNTPAIFIYFNTDCDFCQHEAESIEEKITDFSNIQILFVSTEPIDTIKIFAEKYKFLNYDRVVFLQDNNYIFSTQFDANSIPYSLIYDKNQQLIKKHKGQIKAETILKELNHTN